MPGLCHLAVARKRIMASPSAKAAVIELSSRLHKCWDQDLNWNLYTNDLKEVCFNLQAS